MKIMKGLLIVALVMVVVLPARAQEKAYNYVGAGGCKACHLGKKTGAAYKIWLKSKHAKAYEMLASEEAKAIAKKKGIADAQQAAECLSCHVTAHDIDAARLGKKYKKEDGVACESCHGPGSAYKSRKVMKAITAGTTEAASVGLVKPTEATCKKCHNEKSPTFKAFNFKEMFAKIAHPAPTKTAK